LLLLKTERREAWGRRSNTSKEKKQKSPIHPENRDENNEDDKVEKGGLGRKTGYGGEKTKRGGKRGSTIGN